MTNKAFVLDFPACLNLLQRRVAEPAPRHVQLLVGPRQVGKTTLLLRLAESLGPCALYAAADGPEAALPGFWDRLWTRADEAAGRHGRAVLLIDEVHLLPDWARRLKGEWDRVRRRHLPINIVATGSSSLRLATGSRESLAGRFERVTLGHWNARTLALAFGLPEVQAVETMIQWGTYPGAMAFRQDPVRRLSYLQDAIVEPAIGRDLLALGPIRKPGLLRQILGVAVSSPAQIVSLAKIQGHLQDTGALETIAHYLSLLEEAFLVAALQKVSARPFRRRAAPPKLVTLSNGLLAAFDERRAPERGSDPVRFGAWVENACLAHAVNSGQRVRYWREEPLEVDGVLDGGWGRWAIEVKTGEIEAARLRGLSEFTRRHADYAPLVLCEPTQVPAVERLGLKGQAWPDYLLHGPR